MNKKSPLEGDMIQTIKGIIEEPEDTDELAQDLFGIVKSSYENGQRDAMENLCGINELRGAINQAYAKAGKSPLSLSRVHGIASAQHKRNGLGRKLGGRNAWIFAPHEVEQIVSAIEFKLAAAEL